MAALRFRNGAMGIIETTVSPKPQLGSCICINGDNSAPISVLKHPEGMAGVNDLWEIPGEEAGAARILAWEGQMDHAQRLHWLMHHGGPAIRYRVARELLGDTCRGDAEQLADALLVSDPVRTWLGRLRPDFGFNAIHGSSPEAYENVMGKLTLLGCHAGMAPLDTHTAPWRAWLAEQMTTPKEGVGSLFLRSIVGSYLVVAGYHDEAVLAQLHHRLGVLYPFCRAMDHDIYVEKTSYPDIPAVWRDRPLVDPALYDGGEARYPSIHDLYALAHYPPELVDADVQRRIDAVVAYILHPAYQALEDGYGIMRHGPSRYFCIGWSAHLHRYAGPDVADRREATYVQRLALLARFVAARKHPYMRESLDHLEGYATEEGTYRFPSGYLRERPGGYWVTGAAMGLEADRRRRIVRTIESTFWMTWIRTMVRTV